MQTKKCKGECGEEKPLSEFSRNSNSADGKDVFCKKCKNERSKQRYFRLKKEKEFCY